MNGRIVYVYSSYIMYFLSFSLMQLIAIVQEETNRVQLYVCDQS